MKSTPSPRQLRLYNFNLVMCFALYGKGLSAHMRRVVGTSPLDMFNQ